MSGKAKITGYDELAAADLATGDMIEIVDVSESAAADKNKKLALRGLKPYKVYVALLTQSGTDAPVATILENTLGGVPVQNYANAGTFSITSDGLFTDGKTTINIAQGFQSTVIGAISRTIEVSYNSTSSISIYTKQESVYTNGLMHKAYCEIRVYD